MNPTRRKLLWQAPAIATLLAASTTPAGAGIGYARLTATGGVVLGDPSTYINGSNPNPPYSPNDGRGCPDLNKPWWAANPEFWGCWFRFHLGL